jgi:hypothetical protein
MRAQSRTHQHVVDLVLERQLRGFRRQRIDQRVERHQGIACARSKRQFAGNAE